MTCFSITSLLTSPPVPWKLFFCHQGSLVPANNQSLGRAPPVLLLSSEGWGWGVLVSGGLKQGLVIYFTWKGGKKERKKERPNWLVNMEKLITIKPLALPPPVTPRLKGGNVGPCLSNLSHLYKESSTLWESPAFCPETHLPHPITTTWGMAPGGCCF